MCIIAIADVKSQVELQLPYNMKCKVEEFQEASMDIYGSTCMLPDIQCDEDDGK